MRKVTGDVSLPKELMTYHLSRPWFLTAFGHKLDLIYVVHTCLLSESEGCFFFFLLVVYCCSWSCCSCCCFRIGIAPLYL